MELLRQKDVTYFPVFTPSSEVPVFPPILYPSTFAFLPVPSDTTDSIILRTFSDISFDITSPLFSTGSSVFSPVLDSIVAVIILGVIKSPPFAIVETAVTS